MELLSESFVCVGIDHCLRGVLRVCLIHSEFHGEVHGELLELEK